MLKKIKNLLFENTSTKQIIAKNTFWLFLAEGINKGLLFLLTVLIARYLGVEGYGVFSFAFAFVGLFVVIADFGLSTLMIRDVARDNNLVKKYTDNIAVIKVFLGLVTFGLIFLIIQFMGKTSEVKWLVYLFGIYVIITSFNDFFRSIFRAFEKMQYEAISKIIQGLILFGLGIIFILLKKSVYWIVVSYVIASSVAFIVTLIIVHKNFTKFQRDLDFVIWKKVLKDALPLGLAIFSVALFHNIDKVMLGLMISDESVGLYNASFIILEIGIIFAILFSQTLFPRLSYLHYHALNEYDDFIKKIRLIYYILPILMIITLLIFSNLIIHYLFGDSYSESVPILQILSITLLPVFLNNLYGNIIIIKNKQKIYLLGIIIGLLANVIFNFILIPHYSYFGASIATIIAEVLSFFVFIIYLEFFNKKSIT